MVPVWDEDDFGNGIKIIEIWILKKQYKGFMDNAYTGTNQINKDTEKAKEQQMAEIYYKNDVTEYIGESNGGRSKN